MFGTSLKNSLQKTCALALGCGSLFLAGNVAPQTAMAEGQSKTIASEITTESGISLYGETANPNQVGQGYIIFEQQDDTLIGAFYYPQSEYSCFTGRQTNDQLDVLSLPNHQESLASFSLSLGEMTAVQEIGESEKATLAACRQDVIAFLQQNQTAMDLLPNTQQ